MGSQDEIYLGRQPILDQKNQVLGYELLFRSGNSLVADFDNISKASIGVIMKTLSEFGLQEVVGKRHQAFFNVSTEVLMSEMIELVPKEQVVIELLESIEISPAVVERCRTLKKMGFRLALDDFLYKPVYEPLFDIVDIVKVDLLQMTPKSLEETVSILKKWPLTLLAEKVEDDEQFKQTKTLGFDLFQGYYFARPTIISEKKIDPALVTVLGLMDQVLRDSDLGEIVDIFKRSPSLSYNLLRLVNSVAMGVRQKIDSVRHAVVMLGRENLRRWAQVLLFTQGETPGHQNPLLQTAANRGRFLELLISKGAAGEMSEGISEHGFMVGILSLLDVLMGKSMKEILSQLTLADAVRDALLTREGTLGKLLFLIERLEQTDFKAIDSIMNDIPIELSQVFAAEREAAIWTNSLTESF
ncbi:MAG: EAL and HDOD domain-containing protein [Nitrospiria bacterium]